MNSDSVNLLHRLGSGPRSIGGTPAGSAAGAATALGFAGLLARANAGELESGRFVTVSQEAAAAGVRLSDEQVARLSVAADRAEAAGLRSALVLIDGQALRLDVGNRTITGTVDAAALGAGGEPGIVGGIDGVINLTPNLVVKGETAPVVRMPIVAGASASLSALLEHRESKAPRAA